MCLGPSKPTSISNSIRKIRTPETVVFGAKDGVGVLCAGVVSGRFCCPLDQEMPFSSTSLLAVCFSLYRAPLLCRLQHEAEPETERFQPLSPKPQKP